MVRQSWDASCESFPLRLLGNRAALLLMMEDDYKTINYRGGILNFRIPASWKEEYEPQGGGTFYEDTPDSGTLRLNVMTAKAPMPITLESAPDILAGLVRSSADPEPLANNCALVRYEQRAEEQGQPLHITHWSVAQPLPPSHARIATFSYTMRAHQRNDPQLMAEVDMLDREIRAVTFYPALTDSSQ